MYDSEQCVLFMQLDNIEIANYFDLFNSLIVWSTKKWGCSGEYITGEPVCVTHFLFRVD